MPGRIHPLAQYLMVLALMIGAYSAYARVVVPMIKGPAYQVRRTAVVPPDDLPEKRDNKSRLYSLLPSDGWELGKCKTLYTSQGTLLFQEMNRLDDEGNYALKPFTMIMNDHQSGTAFASGLDTTVPPTVLRCAEAKLGFDGPILLTGNSKTSMRTASLDGEVTIFRPSPTPEKDETLKLVTRDVKVSANTIVALSEVAFSFGPHRGNGKTLTIELEHGPDASRINRDFSSIKGVSAVRLATLERLRIEPGSLEKSATPTVQTPSQQSPAAILSAANVPIDVTCAGPFRFDYASRTATFNEKVFIKQLDSFGDNLNCHQLMVVFADAPQTSKPAPTAAELMPPAVGAIKRLIAVGDRETGKPVVMIANSRKMNITGDELEYRASDNHISCRSKDQVSIISPELNVTARSLAYGITPDGALGDLDAVGPGEFFRKTSDVKENLFLRWQRNLTIRKRVFPETNRVTAGRNTIEKMIVVDGKAELLVQETTHVTSDKLNIAMHEIPEVEFSGKVASDGQSKFRYLPSEVFADSPVTIMSPNVDGEAGKLLVTWPQPNLKALKTHKTLSLNRTNERTRWRVLKPQTNGTVGTVPADTFSPTQFKDLAGGQYGVYQANRFDQPAAATQTELVKRDNTVVFDGSAEPTKDPLKQYIRFKGDEVRVRLQSNSSGDDPSTTELMDLKVDGNCLVHQYPSRDSKEKPLRISGDELRIVPQGKEIYRMLVAGNENSLALVDAQGLQLSGDAIHLDQESNKLWVDGSGDMKVRQEKKPNPSVANRAQTQALAPMGDIDLQWAGGMVFDGAKIYFERNVMMTSFGEKGSPDQSVTRTLSQALSISLAEKVDFRQLSGERSVGQVDMTEMVLVNHIPDQLRVFKRSAPSPSDNAHFNSPDAPIIFQNETFDKRGNILSQRRIAVPQATINAQTNQVIAPGPGKILAHMAVQEKDRRSNSAGGGATASWGGLGALAGSKDGRSGDGINFLQVNFEDRLVASLTDKQLNITGNIRTAFAPVNRFTDTVDPDARQLPKGAMKMRCDHVLLSQWQPSGTATAQNEMVATGNVHVASPGFDAVSERITYTDSNDQVVVEGSARSPAKLWHRPTVNAEKQQLLAKKIIYHPSSGMAETQGVQSMNVNIRN